MKTFTTGKACIAYRTFGSGPPLLLLHGFPQTNALWETIAPALADRFTVVTPDLRGYGRSTIKDALPVDYTFRAMAQDQLALMNHLGFSAFHVTGHDRGGRAAHRLALDAPDAVRSLCVMDIVPTHHLLSNWTVDVSNAYFHWSYLAQPEPFPERMIAADPDHFFEACLSGWGGASLNDFRQIGAYREAWRKPHVISGMTNDYRVTVTLDVADDAGDLNSKVTCPSLVLYGSSGVMAGLFDIAETWAPRLTEMQVQGIDGGHFFVDQNPEPVIAALASFLALWDEF